MEIHLEPAVEALIESRIKAGTYESPTAVLTAALLALDEAENLDGFAPGELEALLAEGEASGPPVDARTAFAEMERRRGKAAPN